MKWIIGIVLYCLVVLLIWAFFKGADERHHESIEDVVRKHGGKFSLILAFLSISLLSGCRYISTASTRYPETEFLDPVTEEKPEFKHE